MGMERVRQSSRQVGVARRRPHARHVEVRPAEVASELAEDAADVLLALRVVDKPRLQFGEQRRILLDRHAVLGGLRIERDRKSTRLNSSHGSISYAVFCLKKKKENKDRVM